MREGPDCQQSRTQPERVPTYWQARGTPTVCQRITPDSRPDAASVDLACGRPSVPESCRVEGGGGVVCARSAGLPSPGRRGGDRGSGVAASATTTTCWSLRAAVGAKL